MNNREAFEAWYQKAYACFGQANFHLNSYGEYADDDIEAIWCAWQAALSAVPPLRKLTVEDADHECFKEPVNIKGDSRKFYLVEKETLANMLRLIPAVPAQDALQKQLDEMTRRHDQQVRTNKRLIKAWKEAQQPAQEPVKPAGFISAKTVEWLNSIGEMIDAKMELTFRTEPSVEPYTIPFYLAPQHPVKQESKPVAYEVRALTYFTPPVQEVTD